MRDLPIFASGTLSSSTTKIAHLFEIELARLKVKATATSGTSFIIVDDIDKCFVGQKLIPIATDQILEVSAISLILNQITLATPLQYDLAVDSYLLETLYTTTPLPSIVNAGGVDTHYLQLWHSIFGTQSGRLLFTDYDVPIIAKLEDGLWSSTDNYGVYAPWPIKYNGTNYETHGKMSSVNIDVSNVDQYFSNVVLTHDALRKRQVRIYTIYLGSATEVNLNVPITITASTTVVAGITSSTYEAMPSLNVPFNTAYFDAAEDKIQEFEGKIESITMSAQQATITVLNYIDSSDDIMIPKNLYTRGRCQFVYKGPQCRFRCTLTLVSSVIATATSTTLLVSDDAYGKFPLLGMEPGETHIIQINQEQMLVTVATATSTTLALTYEQHRSLNTNQLSALMIAKPTQFQYILVVTRAYNSTTAAAHTAGDAIDILLCRKTFHDCRLHYHERMFGSFPAIPKQVYNV